MYNTTLLPRNQIEECSTQILQIQQPPSWLGNNSFARREVGDIPSRNVVCEIGLVSLSKLNRYSGKIEPFTDKKIYRKM